MDDILYTQGSRVFSYRVAGICRRGNTVLLQKPPDDDGYAFPGGQAVFGETNSETLIREFREETGADVTVGELRWVGELFFPWGDKMCQQICLYYDVTPSDAAQFGPGERFDGIEARRDGQRMGFYWINADRIGEIRLYPPQAAGWLADQCGGVRHFVYREEK